MERKGFSKISQTLGSKNHTEIVNLLNRIGFGCNGKSKDIQINSVQLCEFLKQFGRISFEKRIPKWTKELDKSHLQILLETLIKGDGWENLYYAPFSKNIVLLGLSCHLPVQHAQLPQLYHPPAVIWWF